MNREYKENSDYNLNESFNVDFTKIKFNRVKSNDVITKETKLVNLEVSNNRNYNTNIGFAHNGGKRKGSFAIYLEPWHADIFDFIDLRKNHGKEEMRARDLFLALWVPDLFMKRVEEDGDWTLFSPDEAPGLSDVYDSPDDKKFTILYESYEQQGLGRQTIKARKLMDSILTAQIETGTPYMLYKDSCNYKSNQKNVGIIRSSNLCLAEDTPITVIIDNKEQVIDIKTAVELFNKKENILVKSFNIESNSIEFNKILNGSLMSEEAEVLEITDVDTNTTLICTPEHKIFTLNRGYVMAKDLVEDDTLKIIQ